MNITIQKLLNQQIELELQSSLAYLSMAMWAEAKNYQGSAHFFYAQAEEEKDHMMKLIRYLTQHHKTPITPNITSQPSEYQSLHHLFQKALDNEKKVTQSIHNIASITLAEKDLTTFNFLQWFIAEQLEEETTIQQALDLFTLIQPHQGLNLYTIDQEIKKLRSTKE